MQSRNPRLLTHFSLPFRISLLWNYCNPAYQIYIFTENHTFTKKTWLFRTCYNPKRLLGTSMEPGQVISGQLRVRSLLGSDTDFNDEIVPRWNMDEFSSHKYEALILTVYLGVLLGDNYYAYSWFWWHRSCEHIWGIVYDFYLDNQLYSSGLQHKQRWWNYFENSFIFSPSTD